jgi:hypothetical protein
MLVRHHRGERVWSVLREPSKGDEDERREHRELERLIHERTSHTNRIGSLLCCTTCAHACTSATATGPLGGRSTADSWAESCARKSSVNSHGCSSSRSKFARPRLHAATRFNSEKSRWSRS